LPYCLTPYFLNPNTEPVLFLARALPLPTAVYGYSDGWLKGLAIIRFAVYLTTIVTSSVVVCAPGKSKSFYSTCALVYLVLGAVGLITLVVW